jgi:hypothetical protein
LLLTANLIGDAGEALVLHDWRDLIRFPIAGAMLAFLVCERRHFV